MSLSLSTHHLAAIILHSCQTTACTMGSPPSAGPPRRGYCVLVFPPKSLPSLVYYYLGNWWLPLWVAEASLGAAEHGDLSLSTKG